MKAIIKLLFLFLLAASCPLFAQEFAYPKGTYMSLEELQNKTPSEQLDLTITERPLSDIKMNGGNDYRVESVGEAVKKGFIKKNIWGVSDGENLYLNGDKFDCQPWFTKVEHSGKLIIFKGGLRKSEVDYTSAVAFGAIGGAISGAKQAQKRFVYRLDVTSGKTQKIERNGLNQLLSKTPELLAQYQKEGSSNNPDAILKFVILINQK